MTLLPETLLEQIYQGPLEEQPWLGFVDALRRELRAVAASLALQLPELTNPGYDVAASDWDIRILREHYAGRYFAENPFRYEQMAPGRVYRWSDFIDYDAFWESDYYRDFCKPIGFDYAVCIGFEEPSGMHGWLHLARTRSVGDFDAADCALLERLEPHLARALALHARIKHSESEKAAYQQTVEQLDIGTLLIDCRGQLVSANGHARAILETNPAINLREQRVRLADRELDEQFNAAIKRLLADPAIDDAEALTVGNGASLGLLVRPFRGPSDYHSDTRPVILVYLTDAAAHRLAPRELVAQLFGLTPAEAGLATLLADGLSLVEAAERMYVSEGSARSYCKRVFAKTGVNRQAELVRLVLKSVAPLACPPPPPSGAPRESLR